MPRLGTVVCLGIAFAVVIASAACNNNSNSSNGTTPTPTPSTATLTGTVTDAATGAVIANVTVAVGGQTTTTGAAGTYSVSGLPPGSATVTAQHQGHRNLSQSVTLAAGSNSSNLMLTPAVAAGFAGSWSGSWTNTTFGSTGPAAATITADTINQTVTVVLDLGGGVFGGGDPAPVTFTIPYTAAGGSFTSTSPAYGTITATISPTGAITATLAGVPSGGITGVTFTGTITPTTLSGTALITFTGGGTATSTLTLTKTSGPSTLAVVTGQLAARVRTWLN